MIIAKTLDKQLQEEQQHAPPAAAPAAASNTSTVTANVGYSSAVTTALAPIMSTVDSSLMYNNDAYQNAEMSGNRGEKLRDVLAEMSSSKMLAYSSTSTSTKFHATAVPMRYNKNQQLLKNCLELAAMAADPNDLSMLVSSSDKMDIKSASDRIERSTHNKMLEFEDSSEEANRAKKGKAKQPTVVALGSRIKEYKQRCHKATGSVGHARDTKILEYNTLKQKEIERDGGTPPGNRSIRDMMFGK